MTLGAVWKVASSRPVVLLAALCGGLLLGGECRSFRAQTRQESAPVVAAPTKAEERSAVVALPCETVQALAPTSRDRERIAGRYNRPDLGTNAPKAGTIPLSAESANFQNTTQILGERELPILPAGGTALLTLEPGGRVELTVAPKPERLFEWASVYELGAVVGKGFAGDTRGRAWAAVEPIRFGRLHLRAEAGVDLRGGVTDGYGMVGVVWRSRG